MSSSFKIKLFILFSFFLDLPTAVCAHPIEFETKRLVVRPWRPEKDTPVWGEIERNDPSPPFARFFPWLVSDPEMSEKIAMQDIVKAQSTYKCVLQEELSKNLDASKNPS